MLEISLPRSSPAFGDREGALLEKLHAAQLAVVMGQLFPGLELHDRKAVKSALTPSDLYEAVADTMKRLPAFSF